MSIIVERRSINEGLSRIQGAIDPSFRDQIRLQWNASIGGVRMQASGRFIHAVTNIAVLDLGASVDICVSMKQLGIVAGSIADGATIRMGCIGDQLIMESEGNKRKLPVQYPSQYPQFPNLPETLDCLPAKTLRFLLDRTSHTLSKSKGGYEESNCIHIMGESASLVASARGNNCHAVARASHILTRTRHIMLNQRAVAELNGALHGRMDDTVEIGERGQHLFFQTPSTVVAIAKLAADHPVPPAMPSTGGSRAIVARAPIIVALKTAQSLEAGNEVRLSFGHRCLLIESKPDYVQDTVKCEEYDGTDVTLHVHGEVLRSALEALDGDCIQIFIGPGPSDPIKIKPCIDEDVEFTLLPSLINV